MIVSENGNRSVDIMGNDNAVRVGDVVGWHSVQNDEQENFIIEYGIVVQLSKTGKTTTSALVFFNDSEMCWMDNSFLEVVNYKNGELTDKQLENVAGGMSAEKFDIWRAKIINENR